MVNYGHPTAPNFEPGKNARLVLTRWDAEKHFQGVAFRHNAAMIDVVNPDLITGHPSNVEQALEDLSGAIASGGYFFPGGDLAGNGANQVVIGLQGRPVNNTQPTAGQALVWNGSAWIPNSAAGPTGPIGATGAKGITGAQGPQGSPGATGIAGINGATGLQGIQGTTGLQGIQGSPGTTGTQGIAGIQGSPGTTGSQGLQGATGLQGIQGSPGLTGTQGAQGSPGLTGPIGATGPAGSGGGAVNWAIYSGTPNDFTGSGVYSGAQVQILTNETVSYPYGASGNAVVKSFINYLQGTGNNLYTISKLTPPTGCFQDWAITVAAIDTVNKLNYYRADIPFSTVYLTNGTGCIIQPTAPFPSNIRYGNSGFGWSVGITNTPTAVNVVVQGGTGLISWSCIGQVQQVI